ncbi:MAG: hypothetical protein QW434_02660 [Pyrobaculum sp.]
MNLGKGIKVGWNVDAMHRFYVAAFLMAVGLATLLVSLAVPKAPPLPAAGGDVYTESWGFVKLSASTSGEDEIYITVLEGGRPSRRDYFFAVVGPVGEPKAGLARGGSGGLKLGRYYAELARIARDHGYVPKDVELGVLIEILREVEHNATHVAVERMLISAPLRPDRPNMMEISAEFKPQVVTYRVKNTTEAKPRQAVSPEAQTPPNIIRVECIPQFPTAYSSVVCYEWRLVTSTQFPDQIIPTAVVYLTNVDTKYLYSLTVNSALRVDRSTQLRITIPIAGYVAGKGRYYLLTQGFTLTLSQDTNLLNVACGFTPALSPSSPVCRDLLRNADFYYPPRISPGSVATVGVGARGSAWYVKYDVYYVGYLYDGRNYIKNYEAKIDTVDAIWAVPNAENKGNGVYWWYPAAGVNTPSLEWMSAMANSGLWPKQVISSGCSSYSTTNAFDIVYKSNTLFTAQPFLFAIGAVICGASGGTLCGVVTGIGSTFDAAVETSNFLYYLQTVNIFYTTNVMYEMSTATLRTYLQSTGTELYLPLLYVRAGGYATC